MQLFIGLVIKNFLGYFLFFVTPTAATDYWDNLMRGTAETSEEEKALRRGAFWVGMLLGPILLFALSILVVGKFLKYF